MIDRIENNHFKLVSKYEPSGDQPQAIETLVNNIEGGGKRLRFFSEQQVLVKLIR